MRLVAANDGRSLTFLLSASGPVEPLDTTGETLRFRGFAEPRLKNTGVSRSFRLVDDTDQWRWLLCEYWLLIGCL